MEQKHRIKPCTYVGANVCCRYEECLPTGTNNCEVLDMLWSKICPRSPR